MQRRQCNICERLSSIFKYFGKKVVSRFKQKLKELTDDVFLLSIKDCSILLSWMVKMTVGIPLAILRLQKVVSVRFKDIRDDKYRRVK